MSTSPCSVAAPSSAAHTSEFGLAGIPLMKSYAWRTLPNLPSRSTMHA
uniref:Uncharacterized protein n=1 Tax=Arundo donax TaxID=35708 RepID=A0A0A8ZFU2_ARUDO